MGGDEEPMGPPRAPCRNCREMWSHRELEVGVGDGRRVGRSEWKWVDRERLRTRVGLQNKSHLTSKNGVYLGVIESCNLRQAGYGKSHRLVQQGRREFDGGEGGSGEGLF